MIFEYRLKNGLLLCTCDTTKKNPITFSKNFPSLQDAEIKQIKEKISKKEQEVKDNGTD